MTVKKDPLKLEPEPKEEESIKVTMPKQYFVANFSNFVVTERKPGLGDFVIPALGELEILDVPNGPTAKQLAEMIVQDSQNPALKVVEK